LCEEFNVSIVISFTLAFHLHSTYVICEERRCFNNVYQCSFLDETFKEKLYGEEFYGEELFEKELFVRRRIVRGRIVFEKNFGEELIIYAKYNIKKIKEIRDDESQNRKKMPDFK
jgi:hypothetical protein